MIDEDFVRRHGIQHSLKDEPYEIITIDNQRKNRKVTRETVPLEVMVYGKTMTVVFDIIPLVRDVILGEPWLEEHNPIINWRERTLEWHGLDWDELTEYPQGD